MKKYIIVTGDADALNAINVLKIKSQPSTGMLPGRLKK
mgnify:CR=1 FL=1